MALLCPVPGDTTAPQVSGSGGTHALRSWALWAWCGLQGSVWLGLWLCRQARSTEGLGRPPSPSPHSGIVTVTRNGPQPVCCPPGPPEAMLFFTTGEGGRIGTPAWSQREKGLWGHPAVMSGPVQTLELLLLGSARHHGLGEPRAPRSRPQSRGLRGKSRERAFPEQWLWKAGWGPEEAWPPTPAVSPPPFPGGDLSGVRAESVV